MLSSEPVENFNVYINRDAHARFEIWHEHIPCKPLYGWPFETSLANSYTHAYMSMKKKNVLSLLWTSNTIHLSSLNRYSNRMFSYISVVCLSVGSLFRTSTEFISFGCSFVRSFIRSSIQLGHYNDTMSTSNDEITLYTKLTRKVMIVMTGIKVCDRIRRRKKRRRREDARFEIPCAKPSK